MSRSASSEAMYVFCESRTARGSFCLYERASSSEALREVRVVMRGLSSAMVASSWAILVLCLRDVS